MKKKFISTLVWLITSFLSLACITGIGILIYWKSMDEDSRFMVLSLYLLSIGAMVALIIYIISLNPPKEELLVTD